MLLLKDEVADSCLLVDLIDETVELVGQFLLLSFEVLILLETYFVLPFDVLCHILEVEYSLLGVAQMFHDTVVLNLG